MGWVCKPEVTGSIPVRSTSRSNTWLPGATPARPWSPQCLSLERSRALAGCGDLAGHRVAFFSGVSGSGVVWSDETLRPELAGELDPFRGGLTMWEQHRLPSRATLSRCGRLYAPSVGGGCLGHCRSARSGLQSKPGALARRSDLAVSSYSITASSPHRLLAHQANP
jgi:hypothetical protein